MGQDGPEPDKGKRAGETEPLFVNEPLENTVGSDEGAPGQPATDTPTSVPPVESAIDDSTLPEMTITPSGAARNGLTKRRAAAARTWLGKGNRGRWALLLVLFAVAIVSFVQAFQPDDPPEDSATETTVAPTTTTSAPTTTRAPSAPASTTSVAPTTTVAPTTSTTTTTTTAPPTTTTTTTTTTPPPFIEPSTNPIAIDDLTLSITGIGPLRFGNRSSNVLARLAASLGQPDFDSGTVTGGQLDTCDDGTYRVVRWGALSVISQWDDDVLRFHSFRIDTRGLDDAGIAGELQTLSGFKVEATVAEFEDVYASSSFRIEFSDHPDEGLIYELSSGQGLLLWGPVTDSGPDGIVQGIFSTDAC